MLKRALQVVISFVVWSGLLFLAAGTLDWPRAWLLVGLMCLNLVVNFVLVGRKNPEIAEARSKMGEGTKGWDKVLISIHMLAYIAYPIVAGLDAVRYAWSSLPMAAVYPGVLLYLISWVLIAWVLLTNPFLEQTVRIQKEKGHRAITTGPYAMVRHPMYLGMLLQYASFPLVLGSNWSWIPALMMILLLLVRTAKEDKTLEAELEGDGEYKQKTRWRIMRGVW
jgi:protein-S-isoprenylcysteine O-methyltransferase Ste14